MAQGVNGRIKEYIVMRQQTVFQGVATALITPFTDTGVDYDAIARLINWQIEETIDALVLCGTTGEGSTLSTEEYRAVLECGVKTAAGRVPIIAGAGSNCTARAVELAKLASAAGCDALLCVTPYYNKTTQKGLLAHYEAIADATDLPIILYNVPSRTGVNIAPATAATLSRNPKIVGLKEASGDISQVVETAALTEGRLDIYSGNDDQIVPLLACGGKGVISVLSNILPRETAELCRTYFAGDIPGAMALQTKYLPLIQSLFCEVNPIPVKAAMAALGYCENTPRLPLIPMEDAHRAVLLDRMRDAGLVV